MKIFRILAVAIWILTIFSVPCFAAEESYTYRVADDGVVICEYKGDGTDIIVPNEVDGLAVTGIDAKAFYQCTNLTSVTLPKTITNLPKHLFTNDVTVFAEKGSYVQNYCIENNVSFKISETTSTLSANGIPFPDVPQGEWYVPYVLDLYNQGIIVGDDKGRFLPQNNVTRAEFVKMLAVASKDELTKYNGISKYNDVTTNAWYTPYIAWASENKIVNGYEDNTFRPEGYISRQEMMVMQNRYAAYVSNISLPVIYSQMIFSDESNIGDWAKNDVKALQMAGIINGMGNNMLAPIAFSTRAEASKMISSFLALLNKDNSDSEIKGFLFAPNEVAYWQDGKLYYASNAPTLVNGELTIPIGEYCKYHGATVQISSGGKTRVTLKDGTWIDFQNGSAFAQTSSGETINLKSTVYAQGNDIMVNINSISSRFGDTVKMSAQGNTVLIYAQGRAVNEKNWMQGYHSLQASKKPSLSVNTATYGKSGRGRALNYTSITPSNYQKTVMMVFEQHGFEDSYKNDGQVLVNAANTLINHYSKLDAASLNKTQLIIVASANPDGLAEGTTNNGPGRCTVVGKVDMNRDWPTSNYVPSTEARYYTLSPLSCNETSSLKNLISTIQPNVLLDMHGWLNGTYGDKGLASIFNAEMGLPYKTLFSTSSNLNATNVTYLSSEEISEAYLSGLIGFKGYLAGYGYEQGIKSALVEFSGPNSLNTSKLINAINSITRSI